MSRHPGGLLTVSTAWLVTCRRTRRPTASWAEAGLVWDDTVRPFSAGRYWLVAGLSGAGEPDNSAVSGDKLRRRAACASNGGVSPRAQRDQSSSLLLSITVPLGARRRP